MRVDWVDKWYFDASFEHWLNIDSLCRITKVREEDFRTIKETLINKIDKPLEEEDSKTNQLEELDQTQEDSKDKLELHSIWQLARSRTLRCLKRR